MKRKFTIEMEVTDNEDPEETNESAAIALRGFLIDALSDLAFDVHTIQVSCE